MKHDNYIRYWRDLRGLTQAELAKKSSLHQVSIARLESGAQDGSFSTMIAIASALGVTLEELKSGTLENISSRAGMPENNSPRGVEGDGADMTVGDSEDVVRARIMKRLCNLPISKLERVMGYLDGLTDPVGKKISDAG